MKIRDFLGAQDVAVDEDPAYYKMDPKIPIACVIGPDRQPQRLQSMIRVEVPIHYWESLDDERDAIVRVMLRVAEGYPLMAVDYAGVNRALLTKIRWNLEVFVMHPDVRKKIFVPEKTTVFHSDLVPLNRVLCLGIPERSGTLLSRRGRSGYVLPIQKNGVVSLRILNT